uniref:Uncharacterized protein n=1 Tax=Arundo donax TaxID=35708 RepID=A0A0A8ZDE8_ARUDO
MPFYCFLLFHFSSNNWFGYFACQTQHTCRCDIALAFVPF